MTNEELERRVAALERDHSLTRWYTGRVDHDLAVIAKIQGEHSRRLISIETTLDEHTATLAEHTAILNEHTGRLDRIETKQDEQSAQLHSVDAQLRSLTQMVGVVLSRLPASDLPGD